MTDLHSQSSFSRRDELAGAVSQLVRDAIRVLEKDKRGARKLLEQVSTLIGDTGEQGARTRPAPVQTLAPWQERKVVAFIDERLDQRIQLVDLAATARLSRSHFARAFRGSFQETPHTYILKRRVAAAKRAMRETDDPLGHIALDFGFADQSHFSRVFRRMAGMTPNAWRRVHQTSASGGRQGA